MSKPGSSWLPMPVTETVHPVLSKILISEPAILEEEFSDT